MLNNSYISYLKREININPTDRLLLHLFFSDTITQEDVDTLLSSYEIDEAHLEFTFLIALLRKKHPEIQFPKPIIPRLEGVLRFFHHKNATLLQGFNEVGKQLNERGIPILLIKGAAMRYFRPNEPRLMFDVDFLVPGELYDEAVQLAIDLGYSGDSSLHSTDLNKGSAAIDIHRLFIREEKEHQQDILKRMFMNAQKVSAFGVDVLIPSQEDFLLLMMNNAYYNIAVQPTPHLGAYYHFFDCARIIEDHRNLNWDIVFETASEAEILYRIRVYLELLNWALPSFLPEGLLAKIPVDKESMNESVEKDILFKVNDRLFLQQKNSKLSKCKNLSDVVFALKVRIERVIFYVVRKIPVLRSNFLRRLLRNRT